MITRYVLVNTETVEKVLDIIDPSMTPKLNYRGGWDRAAVARELNKILWDDKIEEVSGDDL
jgi:hypothetical protein